MKMNNYKINLKLSIIFVLISIFSASFYGIDKLTSENPPDGATIYIGLSDRDSSSCDICMQGGEYYDSGCKRCMQDGVALTTDTTKNSPYTITWNNNNALGFGDENCLIHSDFPLTKPNSGDTYWIEIIQNENIITSSLYKDKNFLNVYDSVTLQMCSIPTDLQYLRLSNNDGQSIGNGGKILGYIDDISIFEEESNSITTSQNNTRKTKLVYQENFSECNSKSCDDRWVLRDSNMFYIDTENKNFYFDSQNSGTIDYAHYDLGRPISDNFWILQFKMHIDDFEYHPHGKGILNLEPQLRQIFLGIPAIILPIISFFIIKSHLLKQLVF